MGYGRGPIPKGRLPVFSTNTEDEARELLTLACPTNANGEFYAPELAEEQTLENLFLFSQRLERAWELLQQRKNNEVGGGSTGSKDIDVR